MKIQHKLFITLFCFSLVLVISLILLMQWRIGKGMIDYVNQKEIEVLQPLTFKLANIYQAESSWKSLENDPRKLYRLIGNELRDSEFAKYAPPVIHAHMSARPPFPPRESDNLSPPKPKKKPKANGPLPEHDSSYALLDAQEHLIIGEYLNHIQYSKTPIILKDKVIGYLAISKRNRLIQGYELTFIQQQTHDLWIIGLVIMGFVVLLTLPMTHHLVKPIKQIAAGMFNLTQGDYQQKLNLKRQDELGELSENFNQLADTLAENEAARKRWIANISHELRTPVAIFRGELEAMIDDVRPLTKQNIRSANDEAQHLQRLIEDLHQLTSAEIGGMTCYKHKENLRLVLLNEMSKYKNYLAQAGIQLELDLPQNDIEFELDDTRFCQMFENIITNCIKYAQASRLRVSLKVEQNNQLAVICFEDNGVGVALSEQAYLFEYLYRVDDSRNRQTGGAGLGLSICKHIVAAHKGRIYARTAQIGGLAIVIELPIVS